MNKDNWICKTNSSVCGIRNDPYADSVCDFHCFVCKPLPNITASDLRWATKVVKEER
jgi:hypothetical protein